MLGLFSYWLVSGENKYYESYANCVLAYFVYKLEKKQP